MSIPASALHFVAKMTYNIPDLTKDCKILQSVLRPQIYETFNYFYVNKANIITIVLLSKRSDALKHHHHIIIL